MRNTCHFVGDETRNLKILYAEVQTALITNTAYYIPMSTITRELLILTRVLLFN